MMIIKDIQNEVIIHKYKSSSILIALFWEANGIRYFLKENKTCRARKLMPDMPACVYILT